ncbi:hypothetical protein RJT34_22723 [Clitoria ternatea]|uniref:Shikimate dehydrogenase n=1 Tax=Clitoria ternatea TaxID=43366 RepID=A0AAN9FRI2_CLITE
MGFLNNLLVCTPLECATTLDIQKAKSEGANIVELCIHLHSSSSLIQLPTLLKLKTLPAIFRLQSAGVISKSNSKATCLQVMRLAMELGVEFIELDYQMTSDISIWEYKNQNPNCKFIVSSYVNGGNPSVETLGNLIAQMQFTGADAIKLKIDVNCITDSEPIFQMLTHSQVPLIAIAVGSRGLICQLLGPKFGGFLVYGSLEDKPIAGIPTLVSLKNVYKLELVNIDTKVFGLVSNPVGHSKSPILHNLSFRFAGYNGIYVPMLVDDIKEFFNTYNSMDFAGFSVGIPYKEAAVDCCDEVHPLAKSIGAVNTIIRRPADGKLIGYNTDSEASITAIEDAMRGRQGVNGEASLISPIAGKVFVLIGAGGAGRAIAYGAKSRGARVVIFNRDYERAKALAHAVSGEALPYEYLNTFSTESKMILANASSVGMEPNSDETPITKGALRSYELVFDAVYTPRNTRLLQEAFEAGALVVSGVEMFIRQALDQFKLFTGGLAPEAFIRELILEKF